jgi:HEAT repeat protein
MEKTTRSLLALLHTPDLGLRVAAMRVVAALELTGKPVVEALAESLDSDDEAVQLQALRALAQLGPAAAIHLVAPKILQGGPVRSQAMQVLALAGPAAVPVLRKLYPDADVHGRRAIATTLAQIGGAPVFAALLGALPREDLEMVKHLTGAIRQVLEGMQPAARVAAVRELRTFLRDRKTQANPHAVIAALVLLGGISDPRSVEEARSLLLQYLDRKHPEPVRRNAAVSLARLPLAPQSAAALLPQLAPFLEEPEWSAVVQNVLALVQRLELPAAFLPKLLPLLRRSPHVAVQAHVLERLRGQDTPAVVAALLPCLDSPQTRLRDTAEATLKSLPGAAAKVQDAWLKGATPERARRLEAILRAQPEPVRKRCAARTAEHLLTLHEKGDAGWQAYLDFVRTQDVLALRKRAAARIESLRTSRAARARESRLRLMQLLWDLDLLDAAQRYEYALLVLPQSRKDVGREARAADPALRVLGGLARQDAAQLAKQLLAERDLGAEEYYYLGFHFFESGEELRPLGHALLQRVVERYPRHRLRRAAAHKLELSPPGAMPPPPAAGKRAPA